MAVINIVLVVAALIKIKLDGSVNPLLEVGGIIQHTWSATHWQVKQIPILSKTPQPMSYCYLHALAAADSRDGEIRPLPIVFGQLPP